VAIDLPTQLVTSMSCVEGPFRAFLRIASESESDFHNTTTQFFTLKSMTIRQGDTGRILTRWRHPVASRVALDLPYWVMCSASYILIRMAIETPRDAGPFFLSSILCIAKRPCYGQLKIKRSYIIVHYYVIS
jgi:hypothetical protein